MMELNGNEIEPSDGTTPDTSTAPLEILAEFLSLIMEKKYPEAMQHCKTILEYEPQNETVLSFIPLLNEKLKLHQKDPGDTTSSGGDDNANTDMTDVDAISSSSDEDAINEGDTSSEISPYSSGSVTSLSSECEASDSESERDGSEYTGPTRSPSLNRSHSSKEDSSRQDVNSNSLDTNSGRDVPSSEQSNSSKGIQSLDRSVSSKDTLDNSNSHSSKDRSTSSKDVYFSLDSSSSNPREVDKSTSSSSSTRLGKESINRTLAKTIENIRRKYGIRRSAANASSEAERVKNINDLYCAGRN